MGVRPLPRFALHCLRCLILSVGGFAASAANALEPVEVKDAYYGQALFDFYQGEYFDSIVDLLAADSRDRLPNHGHDAELLLGGLYLSYGLHRDAAEIFERLLEERTDLETRDRTWFFLAKIRYQRGYLEAALAAIDSIEGELDKDLTAELRMMHAQVLMDLGRYNDAAALLDRWRGPAEWFHFASYNLGVARVRGGDIVGGARILEEIGRRRGADQEEFLSLQDKANVALGFAYLQNDQYDDAKVALQRVRLSGPFSNKALLGVGWADAEQENYRRALVPWLELRGRDLLDSAVQESLLAIPYAYGQLSANNEAARQYLLAIESYIDETRRLDQAIERIESGEIVNQLLAADENPNTGWYWELDTVPDSYESRYLYHLLASHEFQEALKNFRDLDSLRDNLLVWQENIDVFTHMLETRREAYAARLSSAEALLVKADLPSLQSKQKSLSDQVIAIEAGSDFVKLAPEKDAELWQEIDDLSKTPGLEQEWPEARDARAKLRLLKGVLAWELEKSFPARVWTLRKSLNDVNRSLGQAENLRSAVEHAMATEPVSFEEFSDRIGSLTPRIERLLGRLQSLLDEQQHAVNRIAVTELEARKTRLDTYTVQARFALASIYDRASEGGEQ